ncbi:MAG: hypothetical protein ABI411_11690 [Tahibacter sp.]
MTSVWTARLFRLSDAVARMLLAAAVLTAVANAILLDDGKHRHSVPGPTHWVELIAWSALCFTTALGAYLLTRRRPLGLVLVALPSPFFLLSDLWLCGVVYITGVVLIFGIPFARAFAEARQ